MPEAIPELVWFALLFFAFAFVYCARKLITGLLSPLVSALAHIPLVGGFSADWVKSIEQDIDGKLGEIEHGIDGLIGSSFHRLAELTVFLWDEIKRHSSLLAMFGGTLGEIVSALLHIRVVATHAAKAVNTAGVRLRAAEEEQVYIRRRIKTLERDFSKGIGEDVLPRIKELEREYNHIHSKTIPRLKAIEAEHDSEIANLYDWIKGKASIIGAGTLATAITVALATVGNGWLGCKENPFSKSKNPCGLWGDLARLLPLAGLLAIAFDFPEFVTAAETVAQGIGKAVGGIEGTFALELPPLPPPKA